MAKTVVIRRPDNDRLPFFRGILVQSLVNSGVSVEEATTLARIVRYELRKTPEISSPDLREKVAILLEQRIGSEQRRDYENQPQSNSEIVVNSPSRSEYFSVGILSHSLEACAIKPDAAISAARLVHATLLALGQREIDHWTVRKNTYQSLITDCSQEAADSYLSRQRFTDSGKPLILLVGGVTGSGKSTVSLKLADRLGIAGIQSTDMMREIIRSYLPSQIVPTLGFSSFEAWHGLPSAFAKQNKELDAPVITGYLTQLNMMRPAMEATLARALKEEQSLILEGVHVTPSNLDLTVANQEAIVIPIILAAMEKKLLAKNLESRGRESSQRKASHYLDHLEDIWELQNYLLSQADAAGLSIIQNTNMEDMIGDILKLVSKRIIKHFPPDSEYLKQYSNREVHNTTVS